MVHAFCNWMGLPRFWGRVSPGDTVIGPDLGEGKRGEDSNSQTSNDAALGLAWSLTYYILLVVGAIAWRKLLWPLTASDSSLTTF